MSLPRELTLKRDLSGGFDLMQRPVRELERLRGERYAVNDLTLEAGRLELPLQGETLEIIAEFEPRAAAAFGLCVRVGEGAHTTIGFEVSSQNLFVDRRQSGSTDFSPDFPGKHSGALPLEDGRVRLHIFVDACSVEVFGNDGRTVITDLIFPPSGAEGVELFAEGGAVLVHSLEMWRLQSPA